MRRSPLQTFRLLLLAGPLLLLVLISGISDPLLGQPPTPRTPLGPPQETPQEPQVPEEWFGAGVRPTEARSATEELAGFHLPQGFEVDLIASEPQIAKPLNLAFDPRGRLWVTQSVEYPYPARANEPARDEIRILEDEDQDGTFEKVRVFADKLNIPIGVLPYGDGCLCFSIPNIWYLRDTDGDGQCDRREIVLGPFDTSRDTHGMVNSLKLGLDGWIYANHGYNNQSRIAGKDGKGIAMDSGNTFRFRPDGSRVEHYTLGQVNPFGSWIDDWGILYTADCHSKPITQLLQKGCYESFGKPHDGLGFVASMMDHLHGSTAIAGLAGGVGSHFPATFQDNLFCGNVMTCRINRNHLVRQGATVKAVEAPDLLTSDDPWFRPVDLCFGPDGALYIADFYNKIIGHYEVPLTHPGRDRFRGRIFRVRWTGDGAPTPRAAAEFAAKALRDTDRAFASDNPVIRQLAFQQASISASVNADSIQSSKPSPFPSLSLHHDVTKLWLDVQRHQALPMNWPELIASQQPLLVNHAALAAQRLAMTNKNLAADSLTEMRKAFQRWHNAIAQRSSEHQLRADAGPRTALRALVEAFGSLGNDEDVLPLVKLALENETVDPILSQACRIALRDLLSQPTIQDRVLSHWSKSSKAEKSVNASGEGQAGLIPLTSREAEFLIPILISLKSQMPFDAIAQWIANGSHDQQAAQRFLPAMAASAPADKMLILLPQLQSQYASEPYALAELLLSMAEGQKQNDGRISVELTKAMESHWKDYLQSLAMVTLPDALPLRHWNEIQGRASRQWGLESRRVQGKEAPATFYSSLSHGEDYVGGWETGEWSAREANGSLHFFIVGHNGFPDQPDKRRNRVQLVDAGTQEVLREAWPPRSDVAVPVQWDLRDLGDRSVRLRCLDEDEGTAYAWIGLGEISIASFNPNAASRAMELLTQTMKRTPQDAVGRALLPWLNETMSDRGWRMRMASMLLTETRPLSSQLLDFGRRMGWADSLASYPIWSSDGSFMPQPGLADFEEQLLPLLLARANTTQQTEMAKLLSSRPKWLPYLLNAIQKGQLPREALNAIPEAWWGSLADDSLGQQLRALRPSPSQTAGETMRKVAARIQEISGMTGDTERGAKVFKDRCAVCHQVAGQGKVLGPQLEGIGQRGLQRLAEDILLPNQNVDEAFRMHSIQLDDGSTLTGLVRERLEKTIVLVDQKGEATNVAIADIQAEKPGQQSLMPDSFLEDIKPQELADLIRYLRQLAVRK